MLEAVHAVQRVVDGRVDEEVPRRVAPIPIRRRDVAQPACAQHASNSLPRAAAARLRRAPRFLRKQTRRVGLCKFTDRVKDRSQLLLPAPTILTRHEAHPFRTHRVRHEVRGRRV